MEKKLKHLEMIQVVINRLAGNSFRIKSWAAVLTTAFLAFLIERGMMHLAYVTLFPVVMLWGLDGYYLWQESQFRALYNSVRNKRESEVDFSMSFTEIVQRKETSWFRAARSASLVIFYLTIILFVVLISFIGRNE